MNFLRWGEDMDSKKFAKDKICTSLLKLLKKVDFREISVKEIIAEADISRSSFYYHFGNTDDVLDYIIETFVKEYMASARYSIDAASPITTHEGMRETSLLSWKKNIQFAYTHQSVIYILTKPEYRLRLLKELELYYKNYFSSVRMKYKTLYSQEKPLRLGSLYDFLAYKCAAEQLCSLDYLVNRNFSDAPEEIASIFCEAFSLFFTESNLNMLPT